MRDLLLFRRGRPRRNYGLAQVICRCIAPQTNGLSDEHLAQIVREDQIDVLVDLTMHMAGGRPLLFARKPAPVQICWLAYPGTTGLTAIDYRLTDPYLDPAGLDDRFYSEQSIRLPETFWCYDPFTPEPAVGPLPALERGHVTFGSLNNFCKINAGVLRLWAARAKCGGAFAAGAAGSSGIGSAMDTCPAGAGRDLGRSCHIL